MEVTESWLTLCGPMDCSLPGSSVHGILQAILLEWVAVPFFRGSSQLRDWTHVFHITGRFFTIWATRKGLRCVCVCLCVCIDRCICIFLGLWLKSKNSFLPFLFSTLWLFLGVLGCGDHLGNWLLARLLSPVLTPPLLLLVTPIFLLPLLCATLWISLGAPLCGELFHH